MSRETGGGVLDRMMKGESTHACASPMSSIYLYTYAHTALGRAHRTFWRDHNVPCDKMVGLPLFPFAKARMPPQTAEKLN